MHKMYKAYASDSDVPDYVHAPGQARWREVWNLVYQQNIEKGHDEDTAQCDAYMEANRAAATVPEKSAMDRFRKFIPFWKIDEAKREVYGLVTAQIPDKEDEVCDYPSTLPYYKAVAEEMGKATDGANIMPLREMHQLSAVGKGTQLVGHDDTKEILMGFKVVDDNAWKKVVERVYTGFSQGGDYVRKWIQDGMQYYTAKPSEVSLVDNPCLGAARFVIKADGTMQLQKIGGADSTVGADADKGELGEMVKLLNRMAVKSAAKCSCKCEQCEKGDCKGCTSDKKCAASKAGSKAIEPSDLEKSIENVLIRLGLAKEAKTKRVAGEDLTAACFAYVGDAEDTSTWKLPYKGFSTDEKNKSHVRNALSRFNQTQGIPADEKPKVKAKLVAAAKKHGIEVSEDTDKAVRAALAKMLPGFVAGTKLASTTVADLVKGMYQVSNLALMLQDLQWLVSSTEWERDYEQDGSTVPDELRGAFETMIPIFIAMATEEATELKQPQKGVGGSMKKLFANLVAIFQKLAPEELKKASVEVVTVADLEKAASDFEKASKTCHECMDAMHKAVTDHNEQMSNLQNEHAAKCCKLHKAHMEAMHGHIEKIRKAMGSEDATEQQPAGGGVSDGEKAAAAAALKKAEEDKAAADKAIADAAIKAAKESGNDAMVKALEAMQKSLEAQAAITKKLGEDLAAERGKVEEMGKTLTPHGPQSVPFLVGSRPGQPTGGLSIEKATGTDRGL